MTNDSKAPVRVLLVEDDEDDFILTRDYLGESRRTPFALAWAPDAQSGIEKALESPYDVYLIDYRLGEKDGIELLKQLRTIHPSAPFILLTGLGDRDIDIRAMEAGAADYLVKGELDAQILERAIRYALQQSRTLQALRESEERYVLSARGANDGLWVWDLAESKVFFSSRWKEMLGHADNEIGDSPMEWFARVHPEDLQSLEQAIDAHLSGDTPHLEVEHRMRTADGDYRWILSRGLAVRDSQGKPLRFAGSQTDITDRRSAVDRLKHDAFHDSLTGLPNRAFFMDRLEHAVATRRFQPEHEFAVLFLDLDRFKIINDSLGHTFGDKLLVAVAERLREIARPAEVVARLGGDEFVILLDDMQHATDAMLAAKRYQDALRNPFSIDQHEIFTTVSIGIASSASGYERPQEVLRDADLAMYRAKASGKARHEVFDRKMHEQALRLLEFETDLRRALERKELLVYYQPIIDLESGKTIGFEALLRWQRNETIVSADAIIAVAEETGLILPLGEWVLYESLRQLEEWRSAGVVTPDCRMNVNVSVRQFLQPNFLDRVIALLQETRVPAQNLHLEVTESLLIENAEAAAELLNELRTIGVGLSLDDFGTGYSSLSSLRQFPFDVLKIDRSFIHEGEESRRGDEIIRAIGLLAKLLGMRVTIEGVETEEQRDRMKALSLDYAQGFFFGRPVDAPRAIAALRERGVRASA